MDDHSSQIAELIILLNAAGWDVSEEVIDEFDLRSWKFAESTAKNPSLPAVVDALTHGKQRHPMPSYHLSNP